MLLQHLGFWEAGRGYRLRWELIPFGRHPLRRGNCRAKRKSDLQCFSLRKRFDGDTKPVEKRFSGALTCRCLKIRARRSRVSNMYESIKTVFIGVYNHSFLSARINPNCGGGETSRGARQRVHCSGRRAAVLFTRRVGRPGRVGGHLGWFRARV